MFISRGFFFYLISSLFRVMLGKQCSNQDVALFLTDSLIFLNKNFRAGIPYSQDTPGHFETALELYIILTWVAKSW